MKELIKQHITRTGFVIAALLLSLVAIASAQDDSLCSMVSVAGQWGYTETGWALQPSGWVPSASQGSYTIDSNGNVSGTRYGTAGGHTTLAGTATVNSDCTGTFTVKIYDLSGNLLFTVVKDLLYVDKATEVRAIVTSVTLASGTSVSTVLTVDGKKLFPGHKQ
jgi:hypothetical protein